MNTKFIVFLLTLTTIAISCSVKKNTISKSTKSKEMNADLKALAVNGMNAAFKTYNESDVKKYFSPTYIQHNPNVPTGIEPILGFVPLLKQAGTVYTNHRLIQDGDFVVMHNTYDNAQAFGAEKIVTFDVLRMENGQLAEHWDAVTPLVTETASGRSQIDGPTEITDLDKTEENKALVKHFMNDILFGANPNKLTDYVSTEKYHQHNTAIKDGLDGLGEALQYLASIDDMFQYKTIHKILGEGNFVLTMSEGAWHGQPHSFYDLFRIENGKIVEHWDVIQEIPEKMAHDNGLF